MDTKGFRGSASIPSISMMIILAIATLVLLGWEFDIEVLKRPIPGLVAMNPLTSLLLIFTSLAYIIWSPLKSQRGGVSTAISIIAVLISVYHLLSLFYNFQFKIDQVLYADELTTDFEGTRINRMATNTALNFIVVNIALILIKNRKSKYIRLAQALSVVIITLVIFAIVGYIFKVPEYFGILKYLPMAIHTAICFLLLAIAILMIEPSKGLMKQFTSPYSGSAISKILIPAAIFIPFSFAYLHIWLYWNKVFSTEFSLSIATVCFILVFVTLIYFNANALNKRDIEKMKVAHRLKIANFQLKVSKEETLSLNLQLKDSLQKEKELVAMKNKFIAIASHEFKTPLSSIAFATGFLRKYRKEISHLELDEKLNEVDNQLEHMNYLLNDVLSIGKTEAGKVQVSPTKIEIQLFFDSLLKELTDEINPTHRITLSMNCIRPYIYQDIRMIRVITVNLLTNAIKFSPGQSEIRLNVTCTSDSLRFEVIDNGIGIPSEEMQDLFTSFHRSSNALAIAGTGLGLSIVKKTIDLLKGTIEVESEINKGTIFTVTLPLFSNA